VTALSVEQVRAWHHATLGTAAGSLHEAGAALESEADAVEAGIDTASASWHGSAADAAVERALGEARSG
jgi:hypothetical protein